MHMNVTSDHQDRFYISFQERGLLQSPHAETRLPLPWASPHLFITCKHIHFVAVD